MPSSTAHSRLTCSLPWRLPSVRFVMLCPAVGRVCVSHISVCPLATLPSLQVFVPLLEPQLGGKTGGLDEGGGAGDDEGTSLISGVQQGMGAGGGGGGTIVGGMGGFSAAGPNVAASVTSGHGGPGAGTVT